MKPLHSLLASALLKGELKTKDETASELSSTGRLACCLVLLCNSRAPSLARALWRSCLCRFAFFLAFVRRSCCSPAVQCFSLEALSQAATGRDRPQAAAALATESRSYRALTLTSRLNNLSDCLPCSPLFLGAQTTKTKQAPGKAKKTKWKN